MIAGVGDDKAMIFFSLDKGLNWNKSSFKKSFPNHPATINDFVIASDGAILAAYSNGSVHKSYDLINWTPLSASYPSICLAIDLNGTLYSGTEGGIITSSTDNGINWNTEYVNTERIQDFLVTQDNILFAGSLRKILKKKNNVWSTITLDSLTTFISLSADDQGNIYAHSMELLYKSSDNGNSWQLISNLLNEFLNDCTINSRRIVGAFTDETRFLGQKWGINLSDDFGLTWYPSNYGLPPRFSAASTLIKSDENTYLGTIAAGIFRSTDYGTSWISSNDGLTASQTRAIIITNAEVIYTANWSSGIQKSTDYGETWEDKNNGLLNVYCLSIVEDENGVLFAGTEDGIFKSTDKGENWTETSSAGNEISYHLYKDSKNRIYSMNYGGGIYRTIDGGLNWQRLDQGFATGYVFGFDIDSINNMYVGTAYGWIYKSTDDGNSWFAVRSGQGTNVRVRVAQNGYIFATNTVEGILRSTDRGESWHTVNNGITARNGKSLKISKDGIIFTSLASINSFFTPPEKLYVSSDYGESWENFTSNLNQLTIYDILFDNRNNVYLATDESIWKSNPDSTTLVSDNVSQVFRYSLEQNYPNPFNPTTKINYSIGEQEFVQLSLYNILGEEVAKLVEEIKSAGSYSVSFDASAFPGGVYVYRLQAGGYSSAKKMILLR